MIMKYAVDLLIFGISHKKNDNIRELDSKNLSIILVRRKHEPFQDSLVLPGGYVQENETSYEAANRVLEKETGLTNIPLYLSSVHDDVLRDPRGRTVSVSYLALVDIEQIQQELIENSCWYDVNYVIYDSHIDVLLSNHQDSLVFSLGRKIIDIPSQTEEYYEINDKKLGFDHEMIFVKGLMDLRDKVQNTDVVFHLLPQNFTIGSLEQIYGNILQEKVVNSAFRRVFAKKLKITNQKVKTGGHRPSYLYQYYLDNAKNHKRNNEEMIDIYNPDTLEKTGDVISKNTAHHFGLWHSSVHLMIVDKSRTKTLFQQRCSDKDLYPNMWDIAVGGHISSGESDNAAVKRELEEELGLNPKQYSFTFLKKYKEELDDKEIHSKEVVSVFILYADIDIKNIKLQKDEVSKVKWITKEELQNMIQKKQVIPHMEEYRLLINEILS